MENIIIYMSLLYKGQINVTLINIRLQVSHLISAK